MRNVVTEAPPQSVSRGFTSAMPRPTHAPHVANAKWAGRRTRFRIDEAMADLASALRARTDRTIDATTPRQAPMMGPRNRRVTSMVVSTAASAPDCGSAAASVSASDAWARAPSTGDRIMD